jgi:type IV pilus assembly protein PilA
MKNVKNVKKNNKGFSLVELIVVIAIMAVLVGVLAPQFMGYVTKSKKSTDVKNGQEIASAISVAIADESITVTSGTVEQVVSNSGIGNVLTTKSLLATLPTVKTDSDYSYYATYNSSTGNVAIYCGKNLAPDTADLDKYMVYPTVGDNWKNN